MPCPLVGTNPVLLGSVRMEIHTANVVRDSSRETVAVPFTTHAFFDGHDHVAEPPGDGIGDVMRTEVSRAPAVVAGGLGLSRGGR